jgi:hypothetical protein
VAEHTPTMKRLRDEYVEMRSEHFGFSDLYAAEFDRALAAHDAGVRAAAWGEGYRTGSLDAHTAAALGIAQPDDPRIPHRAAGTETGAAHADQ